MEHHKFGNGSLSRIEDKENPLHPSLKKVLYKALKYSKYDFGVTEVYRTPEQQRKNIEEGVSWTMDTKHFVQEDGFVHAFDFVVWRKGKITWEKKYYRKVMQAFVRAAIEEGVQVEFGGLWESVEDCPHVEIVFH